MPCVPVYAIDTYGYYLEFTVTDTGGTNRTNVPVLLSSIVGTNLVNTGYIDSDGLDTRLKESTTALEYMLSTTNGVMVIPTLTAYQTRTFRLYMDYAPDNTGFPIIVGESGYVTVTDAAALELGSNFEIEVSGYVDTTQVGSAILHKPAAFKIYNYADGTIRAAILSSSSTAYYPDGVGDLTNITAVVNAATHWGAVGDTDDNDYIRTQSTSYQQDLYTLTDISGVETKTITQVVVTFRINASNSGTTAYAKPLFKIGGTVYEGTEQSVLGVTWGSKTQTYTTSPATGVAWTPAEINSMQIGVELKTSNASYWAQCSQVFVTIDIVDYTHYVEATSITSDDMVVKVAADGTNMKLYIDGVEKDSDALSGASVTDNANNWILFGGTSVPYVDYYKHTVGGTLIAKYQPASMLTSTTLPDLEGAAQNGTITWGANANLTVVVKGITAFTSYVPSSGSDAIADTIKPATMPTSWYSDISDIADLPFYSTFNDKATEMGMPTQTLYVMMMLGTAVAVGLGVLVFTGSVLVAVLVCGVTIAAGVNTGVLSGWMLFIYLIFGVGIMYLARQN